MQKLPFPTITKTFNLDKEKVTLLLNLLPSKKLSQIIRDLIDEKINQLSKKYHVTDEATIRNLIKNYESEIKEILDSSITIENGLIKNQPLTDEAITRLRPILYNYNNYRKQLDHILEINQLSK